MRRPRRAEAGWRSRSRWNLVACNYGACSSWGVQRSFTTSPAPAMVQLGTPSNNAMNTGTTPTLSWSPAGNAVGGITQYTAGMREAVTYAVAWTTPFQFGTTVTVPANTLVLGKSYIYGVIACTDQACSPWPPPNLFTTSPGAAPVTETYPSNGQTNVGTAFALQWALPQGAPDYPNVTHFYVNVYDDQARSYVQTYADVQTALSEAAPGQVMGHTYQWDVEACNGWVDALDCSTDGWFAYDTAGPSIPPYPGYSTSLYMSALHANATSFTAADDKASGCQVARQASASGNRLIILAFGGQTTGTDTVTGQTGVRGTQLQKQLATLPQYFRPDYETDQTRPGVVFIAEEFIDGYSDPSCNQSSAHTFFVIGTNNSLSTTQADADEWSSVVSSVSFYAGQAYGSKYTVVGGNDMEPGFGPYAPISAWVDEYYSRSGGQQLYNFGSCDGCHSATTVTCNQTPGAPPRSCTFPASDKTSPISAGSDWTTDSVYQLAGGKGKTLTVPEIYTPPSPNWPAGSSVGNGQADQWGYILLYGNANVDPTIVHDIVLAGVLSEYGSDATTNTPSAAWAQIWDTINDPRWYYRLLTVFPQQVTDIAAQ